MLLDPALGPAALPEGSFSEYRPSAFVILEVKDSSLRSISIEGARSPSLSAGGGATYGFVEMALPCPGPALGRGRGPEVPLTGNVAKRPPRGPDTLLLPSETVNELGCADGGPEIDPNSLTEGGGILGS